MTYQSEPEQAIWEKFLQHLQNEQVTEKRRAKLLQMYRTSQRGLKNKLSTSNREDIEDFLNRLNTGKFKRVNGTPYGGSSKADIKKFLKQFFKWHQGMGEFYPDNVRWIKSRIAKDELPIQKDTITKDQAVQLAARFENREYQALTLLLFDSGFRISEMFSVRKCDLTWENWDTNKKCWWIQCNDSKTFTRKVPVPLFTEEISSFMKSIYVQGKDNNEILFPMSHTIYNRMLKQYSYELFKFKISPHHLRHSSATYYAEVLGSDLFKFADRMGWSYSAQEFKTYVRKSKSRQIDSVKTIYSNEVQVLKDENTALKQRLDQMEKDQAEMKSLIEKATKFFDKVEKYSDKEIRRISGVKK